MTGPHASDPPVPHGFVERLSLEGMTASKGPLFRRGEGPDLSLGFRVDARHCNMRAVCHGGWLSTMADMQLGLTLQETIAPTSTIRLAVEFLAPVPIGAWVECRATILKRTGSMAFAQCHAWADGELAFRADGVFKLLGDAPVRTATLEPAYAA